MTDTSSPQRAAVALRWADGGDCAVVADLVRQLLEEISARIGAAAFTFDALAAEQNLRRWMEQGHYQALLAVQGDRAVGVATVAQTFALYAGGPIGIIQEFFVEPAGRSAGLGASMLARLIDLAQRRGWAALELCTPPLPSFDDTLRFYQAHEFEAVGGRKMRRLL